MPLLLLVTACSVYAQTPTPSPRKSDDDVVRVYTELVQTDVMVFDKQGRFVNGLTKDNFELRIDGKPRSIEGFELITAGSNEESQLAAARGATTINLKRPVPLDRGRIVFFYVDDFHMDLAGLVAAKKVITTFIEKEMGQNDQAAIASPTGQIGFLQQLTSDRSVLKLALDRLNVRSYSARDHDRPAMSEYEALLIDNNDREVFEFFVNETMRLNAGMMSRDTAMHLVRSRAETTQNQAARYNANTLYSLEKLVESVKNLPGRKLVFFLSGGFLIENRRGDSYGKLRDITTAAARNGVVIYSMDTRGLVASLKDASIDAPFDPYGQLSRSTHGELRATQDGMNALAVDTGGKAIFNTNDLKKGLAPALNETSTYYLLAWKPDAEAQKHKKFRNLEVKLINRPDLFVRVRKGFFDLDPPAKTEVAKESSKPPKPTSAPAKLRESIAAPYPERGLPISLSADYYDVAEKGAMVSTSILIPAEFLTFSEEPDGKIKAITDISGAYFDVKGVSQLGFLERITTTTKSLESVKTTSEITFNYPAKLPPGLYQVRVAARDEKSGRAGSAHAWIEIPDLSKKKLTMSSLLLGERPSSTMTNVSTPEGASPVALSASHRFHRESTLRFLLFAYNTVFSPVDQKPDVAVQVQVVRDDQPVITTALRKVGTDGALDLLRLPYAAEVPLSGLQPGRYMLHVTLIDRVSKQSTSRQTHFDVY